MSLSTPGRHLGGAEVKLHSLLTLAIDGEEWSASLLGCLTTWKEPRNPLNRRLGGPQSRSGLLEKTPLPRFESNIVQPVA